MLCPRRANRESLHSRSQWQKAIPARVHVRGEAILDECPFSSPRGTPSKSTPRSARGARAAVGPRAPGSETKSKSARSRTTNVRAVLDQCGVAARSVDADDQPEARRAHALRRRRAHLQHPEARAGVTPRTCAAWAKMSGAGFPFNPRRSASMPSTRTSKRSARPALPSTSAALLLAVTTRRS